MDASEDRQYRARLDALEQKLETLLQIATYLQTRLAQIEQAQLAQGITQTPA